MQREESWVCPFCGAKFTDRVSYLRHANRGGKDD